MPSGGVTSLIRLRDAEMTSGSISLEEEAAGVTTATMVMVATVTMTTT